MNLPGCEGAQSGKNEKVLLDFFDGSGKLQRSEVAIATKSMNRILEPELLDELPADDPRAVRSRRDLQRVNGWMGHARILKSIFSRSFPPGQAPKRIVELGAGDGTFLLEVARRMAGSWPEVELLLVDRQNILSQETMDQFGKFGWRARAVQGDVFAWLTRGEEADLLTANLFLHHFQEDQLIRMFEACAGRTGVFCALEPRRTKFGPLARKLLWLIGCNAVTQHDAFVSIRAGFFGKELSQLWPAGPDWELREWEAGFFSHALVAQKRAGARERHP